MTYPIDKYLALVGPANIPETMTSEERQAVIALGHELGKASDKDHPWLVVSGPLVSLEGAGQLAKGGITTPEDQRTTPEDRMMRSCRKFFGYPDRLDGRLGAINVLVDSQGGSLDSAFKIIRYLTWYFGEVNVYVPRRAKSASTLLALGADHIVLSGFGELGPLDAQIPDPRKPGAYVSALDCYQSVDYVRLFGINTMSMALKQLSSDVGGQVTLAELPSTASSFAIGAINPMLKGVRALDFGAWGRSLKIGEGYAQILLQSHHRKDIAEKIAERLVYRYTHHLFPIDYREASDIGLDARLMDENTYERAMKVVDECHDKMFIDFVYIPELEKKKEKEDGEKKTGSLDAENDGQHERNVQVTQPAVPAALKTVHS